MGDNVFQLGGRQAVRTPEPEPKFVFREVKTYETHVQCPSCENGNMIAASVEQMLSISRTLAFGSPNYNKCPHTCNACGHEAFYADRFPTLRYFYPGQEPV